MWDRIYIVTVARSRDVSVAIFTHKKIMRHYFVRVFPRDKVSFNIFTLHLIEFKFPPRLPRFKSTALAKDLD